MKQGTLVLRSRSPYARFNLRRNPFGELTRQERAELAIVDVQRWVKLLKTRTAAVQFVGNKGEGKTTHLLALQSCLPGAAYVYLPEDGALPVVPDSRPMFVDEAQRLGRTLRRHVFGCGGPLVLGTHEDFSAELRAAGLDVITVDVAADRSPDQLAQILNARIEASRVSNLPVPRIDIEFAQRLMGDFGDNIRAIEQTLYDDFQKAVQTGLSWPPVA